MADDTPNRPLSSVNKGDVSEGALTFDGMNPERRLRTDCVPVLSGQGLEFCST